MAALAPIIINDGAATPVARTFNPVKIDQVGVAHLADRSGGIAVGFPVVSLFVRSPSKDSRNYKIIGKIVVPTLEITSPSTGSGIQPAPTKAYDCLATIEFVCPERSTLAERKNILAFVKNFLANANVTNAVEAYEAIY